MKTAWRNIVGLLGMLQSCRWLFLAATIATATAQLALVGVSVVSVWITSIFIADNQENLSGLIALLLTLVVAHATALLLEVWWSHEIAYKILHIFRTRIYEAIHRIAPLGLQGRRTGDVASMAMDDAEQLEWFYAHTASTAVCAVVSTAIFVSALCFVIGPVGLIVLLPAIVMLAVPLALMRIQYRQGKQLRQALVDLRIAVLDLIQGQRELRSLGMVAEQQRLIEQTSTRVHRLRRKQAARKSLENGLAALVAGLTSIWLLVILTERVISGALDAQKLPLGVVLAGMSTVPVLALAGMLARMGEIQVCASRIHGVLAAQDPISEEDRGFSQYHDGENGTLRMEDVSFSYGQTEVLKDISLDIPSGTAVALVGASGAGKTTMANLALRFLDPADGDVRFDGVSLRASSANEHRLRAALVLQDCHIFAGSVRRNLLLARPAADDNALWASLQEAEIADVIRDLGGLDATVGDRGGTLSGGERQRLGIARAFLRDPDLLVLDEPLANIDPFLETAIADRMRQVRDGRATLVIAHRLASILIADHIVLIDSGRIVASGTHEQMLQREDYRILLGGQIPASD